MVPAVSFGCFYNVLYAKQIQGPKVFCRKLFLHTAALLPRPADRNAMQGEMFGVDAQFTTFNPLGDPTLSTIESATVFSLDHAVWLQGMCVMHGLFVI